ncbi:MAG TPA: SpoIIE family protein phosphatase [Bacteroidota bacterium]|nr:SpoIIE family protein phosphatase [Bacteroidota bacterium]
MKTILLVEDDPSIVRGLRDNLEREGYRVCSETDGRKGYERAKREQPDLVILDVMLPSMDGFQICSLLKREGFGSPVFLLTGLTQERSRIEGLGKGADDYIGKPFNLQEFLLRVRNALRQRDSLIGRARLLEDEFLKARKIQMASLPRRHPRIPGLDVVGTTLPATEVGGDYFDYLKPGNGRLGVIVADVSGKGMPAAMYVQKMQGIIRSNEKKLREPSQTLRVLQEHLGDTMESSSFVTAVVAFFDTRAGTMSLAQAGHLPVLLRRKSAVRLLKPPGIWIGKTSAEKFEKSLVVETVRILPGDTVVFYSDGLIEARDARGREFGLTRLKKCLGGSKSRKANDAVSGCLTQVRKFTGAASQSDDITIVAVSIVAGHPHT